MESFHLIGLYKSFNGVRALADVNLELPSTGITAIIGPNGAGKTTLINILTGFLRADSGRFFLGQREITYLAAHSIAKLGVARTFQELRLVLKVSVLENVMLARPNQRGETLAGALLRVGVANEEVKNRDEAALLLRLVGLEQFANALASELSYGQQKLLTLACCLATEARILLLDEPIAGVHQDMVKKILDLMRKLRDDGKLIVFIEHDISAIRDVADHLIVMDHGKVRDQGLPEEVLSKPEIMEAYLA